MRLLLVLLAAGAALFGPAAAAVPPEIAQGFFGARSGDALLLREPLETPADGALGLFSNLEGLVAADPSASSASPPTPESSQLFDMFARALGLPPRSAAQSPLLAPIDPRRALPPTVDRTVLLSLPGVAASELSETTPALAQSLLRMPLVQGAGAPRSSVAQAVTLATGVPASEHGIIGAAWRDPAAGVLVRAFEDTTPGAAGLSRAQSLGDRLARNAGAALSFSSDRQLALAHCVSPGAAQRIAGRVLCAGLDTQGGLRDLLDQSVVLRPAGLQQAIVDAVEGRSELFAPLLRPEPGLPARLSLRRSASGKGLQALVVELRDGGLAEFHVDEPADLALLAELAGAELLLRSRLPAAGSAHLAVNFAAPERLRGQPDKFRAALLLIEAALPALRGHLETADAAYLLAFAATGRTEPAPGSPEALNLREELSEAALRMLGSYPEASLPQLYLRPGPAGKAATDRLQEFCELVREHRQRRPQHSSKTAFVCLGSDPALARLRATSLAQAQAEQQQREERRIAASLLQAQGLSAAAEPGFPEISNSTMVDIRRYQIAMWFSIGMAFVVILVAYAVANMSFRKDTLLYGGVQADIAVRGS